MSRTTRTTLIATAITLACVGASMAATPQVLAQSTGRQVYAFAPFDPMTYPGVKQADPEEVLEAAAVPREVSVQPAHVPQSATEPSRTLDLEATATKRSFHIAGSPVVPDKGVTSEPTEAPEAAITEVQVELPATQETPQPTETAAPAPDVDSPESLTVIVNKRRPLPADYVPADLIELPAQLSPQTATLRPAAAEATQALFAAAAADDIDLTVISAYRSYAYQQELYDGYVAQHGTAHADTVSAQPGASEHQTGLAIDVDSTAGQHTLTQSFGQTDAGRWLAAHARDYGFVIRYPDGAQEVTGFHYEPWHLRYFGEQFATRIAENSGIAESEFGLESAPGYQE